MSDLQTLRLNLRESSIYSDNDDDEFQSVSSSVGEVKDTYRVLDEACIGSSTEIFKTSNRERRFVEFPEYQNQYSTRTLQSKDNCHNNGTIDPLLWERPEGSVDSKMIGTMDVLPVREREELVKERDYQLMMKKRINDEVRMDSNYTLSKLYNNKDDNNNNNHNNNRDNEEEEQIIDYNIQNPMKIEDDSEQEYLYDSLEAEQPPRTQEFRSFPTNSNPLQPAFNDENLDQFYPKSPQKELKSMGPVKGNHMIFSQRWSDEQLYQEFEKMANDYNKNQSLSAPNFVQQSNQENVNRMSPAIPDFQESNPMSHQESPKEKLWNDLSHKQHILKQSPVSMDFVRKPKKFPQSSTNYVEDNKINYGKPGQNQSYMARHHFRKDFSGSLSKISPERKVSSGRSEPVYGTEQDPVSLWKKPSSAEDAWRKRSAKLLYQREKKLPPPPGKLQKYPSDTRVNYRNSRPYHLQPLKPNSVQLSRALVPMEQRSQVPSPSVIDLEPISKDFIMEDGQRLSVDINLKLLSPPLSSRITKEEMNAQTFQPLPPFYSNENNQTVNLKTSNSTTPREQQGTFSLQPLPEIRYEACPISEYQGSGPSHTDATLNSTVGYVARYQRQRDPKPHYKVYSVDDYRKMQKEVKLGKLGPDLDSETLREKVEKRQKQYEYAKKVYETNKETLKSQKPANSSQPQKFVMEEQSRRKLAIEYAKSVPKPVVKPTTQRGKGPEEVPPSFENQLPTIKPTKTKKTQSADLILNCGELEKLCLRHEQDKRNAENIRKKITPS